MGAEHTAPSPRGSKFSTCWIHGNGKMESRLHEKLGKMESRRHEKPNKMKSCHHKTHKGRRVADTPALGYGVGRSSLY